MTFFFRPNKAKRFQLATTGRKAKCQKRMCKIGSITKGEKCANDTEHMFTLPNNKRVPSVYYYHASKTCLPKEAIGNMSTALTNEINENDRK
jgi:hypothetical protein